MHYSCIQIWGENN